MKRMFTVAVAILALSVRAQETKPSPQKPGPEAPPSHEMQQPLTALPYTPSLDVPSMDRAADPCTDFYQFSCGGWMASNPIPADQAAWSVYGKLEEENMQYLWGILNESATPAANRDPVQQKIGDYFASCMDTAAIEQLGAKPLQPLLDRIAALSTKKELA